MRASAKIRATPWKASAGRSGKRSGESTAAAATGRCAACRARQSTRSTRAGEQWPPGVFVDHDISAGGENRRREYRRMHAAIERGEVTVVVSKALDRLWHTLAETAEALVKMRAAKIHLELFDTAPSLALDGRLVQVFPATWAAGLADPGAAPPAPLTAVPTMTDRVRE